MLPLTFITGLLGINVGIAGASYSGMSSTLAFVIVCSPAKCADAPGRKPKSRRDA